MISHVKYSAGDCKCKEEPWWQLMVLLLNRAGLHDSVDIC